MNTQTPATSASVAPRTTKGTRPISGVMYYADLTSEATRCVVTVEQTEQPRPLGFLTLEQNGQRVGLELTPEIIDVLLNRLCDAGIIMDNHGAVA